MKLPLKQGKEHTVNMPTRTTTKPNQKEAGLVPLRELAHRCGSAGQVPPFEPIPILEGYGLKRGDIKQDWAGNPVVTSTVASRVVNGYEKARVEEAKQREAAAALEREKREVHFAGGYTILEDARGPQMTGLTYAEMRAEEARRGNYPPSPFGSVEGPVYDSPEEARAARQARLDKMNESSRAAGRAAAGPPPRRRKP